MIKQLKRLMVAIALTVLLSGVSEPVSAQEISPSPSPDVERKTVEQETKKKNLPIIGFTWYSLLDQVDWDTALREDNGNVNPLGLFDLDRKIRPVGAAYKRLVEQWHEILPTESLCLDMNMPMDGESSEPEMSAPNAKIF